MTLTLNQNALLEKLVFVYGPDKGPALLQEILQRIRRCQTMPLPSKKEWVTERDVMVIAYGDSLLEDGPKPLQSLLAFARHYWHGYVSAIHLLPFYPYSSDDGFSVIDYLEVNPELGSWEDVQALSEPFDLMFDGVINHISQHSVWFKEYLAGNPRYADYFIEGDPEADYSTVTRPRALPLLHAYPASTGVKHIWTTFSEDQIDLNFANEKVLLDILDVLLFYAVRGARYIRLDAIGFLWKRLGTTCMHLEETHAIVQIIRQVLDAASPGTLIITETNVPHRENISYFGDGWNESHMVYQFPLPPLTLHTILTGNSQKLLEWARTLEPTSDRTTFFNFLASHDGIGVRPVEKILSPEEIQYLVDRTLEHGGFVSMRDNGDGTQSPYELNITYMDALSCPDDPVDLRVKRFVSAHGILLSMRGVPGIYIHSLLGSQNDLDGVRATGRYRSINRKKLDKKTVEAELRDPDSLRSRVFQAIRRMLEVRRTQPAFHPNADQQVMEFDRRLFALLRTDADGRPLLALVNIANESFAIPSPFANLGWKAGSMAVDLLGEDRFEVRESGSISMAPYQVRWIKPEAD